LTRSLKPPAFNHHGTYQVISWFQAFAFFKFDLHRYIEAPAGNGHGNGHKLEVGLYKLNKFDPIA
jgi:hypothetical protein